MTDDLIRQLMAAGLTKQQATSVTTEKLIQVFMKEDGKILVVSEDILLEKPLYSEFYSDLNWFNSPLNEWLNSEFIQSTFTEKEKEAILESEFEENEESYSQKLFLLNKEEAEQYFADDNDRIAYTMETKTPDAWR